MPLHDFQPFSTETPVKTGLLCPSRFLSKSWLQPQICSIQSLYEYIIGYFPHNHIRKKASSDRECPHTINANADLAGNIQTSKNISVFRRFQVFQVFKWQQVRSCFDLFGFKREA